MISRERLLELFKYDDVNGRLVNKIDRGRHAKTGQNPGYVGSRGYRMLKVDGQMLQEHQIIWLIFNDELPEMIDHIDRNKTNNLISNLRASDRFRNQKNTVAHRDSSSQIKNLTWCKARSKWSARFSIKGKRVFVGYFVDAEEAKIALMRAETKALNT